MLLTRIRSREREEEGGKRERREEKEEEREREEANEEESVFQKLHSSERSNFFSLSFYLSSLFLFLPLPFSFFFHCDFSFESLKKE